MASDRHVELTTPLGKDVLLFHRMTVTEELGRMFHFSLDLLSTDDDIPLNSVLGGEFSLRLETREGHVRHFHGKAVQFSHVGRYRHYARYVATVRPWLWMLTQTANCKIFQEKSVPDIVKQVFRDQGFTDFKDSLSGSYPERTYTVQYRESDFNFVSRLMEHAGIYYFFEHEASKHTLVLADSYTAHSPADGYATITYYPPDEMGRRKEEHFDDVTVAQQVRTGKYKVDSFDFEKPRSDLEGSSVKARSHDHSDFEIYDYTADYAEASDGDDYAKTRLNELQARHEITSAVGDACGIGAGNLFTLENHPRDALNQEYLILSSTHNVVMEGYETESATPDLRMRETVRIEGIESSQPFHPEERTPKPAIYGPQTAIVVGKKGEEIWTDEYGRVKLQFHWDREGKEDENSSCWIRVSQRWAGKQWGGIELPRIGQEVMVHFMNGDPDQPIVTGRVYNEDHKVPYELPANKTQSGIKSRSTLEGTAKNFNEIRFEDKLGEEEIFIQAEKDQNILIKNKHMETVRDSSDHSIQEGRRLTIGATDHIHVKSDRNEKVDGKQSLTVGGDQPEKVGSNHALDAGQEIHLKAGMKVIIEAGMQISLIGAGGFIDIGPAGVTIQGTMVNINSGGAAGSGSGSSPTEPDDAEEVEEGA